MATTTVFKWYHWAFIILLLWGILAGYEWICNKPKLKTVNVPSEDTMASQIFAAKSDSLAKINLSLLKRDSVLNDSIQKLKEKKNKIQVVYKTATDTIQLIASCDSLSNIFEQYIRLSDLRIASKDSLIENLNNQLTQKDSLVSLKEKFASELRTAFNSTIENNNKLQINAGKQIQWLKVKEKAYWIVIGAAAVKIFIDSQK